MTNIDSMIEKCRKCCKPDHNFDFAILEYDKRYVKNFYPELTNIVKDKTLHMKLMHKENARPMLNAYKNSLKDYDGTKESVRKILTNTKPTEVVSIATWKYDGIKEYIQSNVL